ncbi:MAG: hypothetical protein WA485_16110 [Candidatus Sulfotelmatobacter sp.]
MKTSIRIALVLGVALPLALCAQAPTAGRPGESPLFVKVQLDNSVKLSALKPGDSVEGKLARDVYSPASKVFAAGSEVRLTVNQVERKRRIPSARWPWVAKLFMPRHQNFPMFKDASISMPDGSQSLVQASLLSANRMKEVSAVSGRSRKKDPSAKSVSIGNDSPAQNSAHGRPEVTRGPVLFLEAYQSGDQHSRPSDWALPSAANSAVLAAGTACRVLLLKDISGSKSHPGDAIQARLLEPVLSDSHIVLPAGSLFEGRVLQATRPRIMSRAGSLTISFESITLPGGNRIPVSASLTSLDVSSGSPTKIDREGRLHGSRPGVAWMLINGGATAGLAKVADDTTQLVIETIVSTATDASTAGTARIVSTAVSGVFLLTRKGQDVVLPSHTEMSITLNRPFTLSPQLASAAVSNPSIPTE